MKAVETGRLSVPDCYEQVLTPVQRKLWTLWHAGSISIADEHLASSTTHMVMNRLYPLLPRARAAGRVAVIASVEGNTHELGARMVADYFEIAGWKVVFLGADVPPDVIAEAVDRFGADLVALSASLPDQVRATGATIKAVRSLRRKQPVRVLVGGPAFAGTEWRRIGADGSTNSAAGAVALAEKLVA